MRTIICLCVFCLTIGGASSGCKARSSSSGGAAQTPPLGEYKSAVDVPKVEKTKNPSELASRTRR